jgi:prepilin-type N-terminal cleavage/methylation domain-containing protein
MNINKNRKQRMLDLLKCQNSEEEGFTLIELMIVVVIIGILAAVAIPIFANQQKAAMEASVKSDLKTNIGSVVLFLTKYPAATNINKHSEYINVPPQPTLYVTKDNIAQVLGSWDDYRVIVKNSERNYTCNYYSVNSVITCGASVG